MKPHNAVTALCAVLATTVSFGTGFLGSHNLLAAVPAMMLLRYVLADFEGTLTAALIGTGVVALIGLGQGDMHAVLIAVGGFVATEVAQVGTVVRRRASIAGVQVLLIDAALNCSVALAAAGGTAAIAVAHPPSWVALSALVVLSLAVAAFAVRALIERGTPD